MPGLLIHDGYTLTHKIAGDDGFPGINITYRPAVGDALNEWRMAQRASGKDETSLRARFVADHLVDWDVTEDANLLRKLLGKDLADKYTAVREAIDGEMIKAPIDARIIRALPDKRLNQLFDVIAGYARRDEAERDLKN